MTLRILALCAAVVLVPAAVARAADDPPPGANDWTCKPTAAHPRPVVLVHGASSNMGSNWRVISPRLKAAGYCVFALTYGVDPRWDNPWWRWGGSVDMRESSKELAAFVDRVLAATGVAQVDLVGHSEGTMMPRWWLKFYGGAAKVDHFVALTPLWRGTEFYGAATLYENAPPDFRDEFAAFFGQYCTVCLQALRGSDYLEAVNAGGEAAPGVSYTSLMTRYDELVIPYTSGIMNSPQATNIVIQDVCPADLAEHSAMAIDPVTQQLILNALDPSTAQPPPCPLPALPLKRL